MNDMAWSSISIHHSQLHNFGYCMMATPVYANIMRSRRNGDNFLQLWQEELF